MYVIVLIGQYSAINVIAVHAIPKIYLNIKISDFAVKNENIMVGFINIHDRIYVS